MPFLNLCGFSLWLFGFCFFPVKCLILIFFHIAFFFLDFPFWLYSAFIFFPFFLVFVVVVEKSTFF